MERHVGTEAEAKDAAPRRDAKIVADIELDSLAGKRVACRAGVLDDHPLLDARYAYTGIACVAGKGWLHAANH